MTLGIPMYGADPRLVALGTKTGCRRLFAEVGVPHPLGVEDLHTLDEVADARRAMRAERPDHATSVIVKLNEGVSGAGNAWSTCAGSRRPGRRRSAAVIRERLRADGVRAPGHAVRRVRREARRAAAGSSRSASPATELRSPSVQLRVHPGGKVELLSTHDQLLGGPSGQSYLGCRFPADLAYARLISSGPSRSASGWRAKG